MIIIKRNKNALLSVDDAYAKLVALDDAYATFQFTYNISQIDAVRNNALQVDISVYSKSVNVPKQVNTSRIISLLTRAQDVKNSVAEQQQYLVAKVNSDISAYVNNQAISQILAGLKKDDIISFRKTKLAIKHFSDVQQENQTKPFDESKYVDIFATALMKMLVRSGIDPTDVVDNAVVTSTRDNVAGLSSQYVTIDKTLKNLQKFYTSNVNEQVSAPQLENTVDDEIFAKVYVLIPLQSLSEVTQFYVNFDLIDKKTNASLHTITKQLDVYKQLQLYSVPKLAPNVLLNNSSKYIDVRQNDKNAIAVNVYKKDFSSTMYNFVGTFMTNNGVAKIPITKTSGCIYRVVPVGKNNVQGINFKNVILTSKYDFEQSMALDLMQISNGIRIKMHNMPMNVISIEFLVKNLTTFEKQYKSVDQKIHRILTQNAVISVVDSNVSSGNVYEYAVRLTYSTGKIQISRSSIIEFLKPEQDKVLTKIRNIVVDNASPNVTFDVVTTLSNSDISILKYLLESQGITQYDDLLATQRDSLNGLIAHNIQRVDTTTGTRSDFGIISTEHFSDVDLSINRSVEKLQQGHKYRYEITPLVRNPDTLFFDYVKETTDRVTKKTYRYSPAKYQNPLTLENGTLYSDKGIKQLNAKDQMSYGAIGSIISTDVALTTKQPIASTPTVDRINNESVIISWDVEGDLSQIDHFIVVVDNTGTKKIIGKAHSQSQHCTCMHALTESDIGSLTYGIFPVYTDYTIGKILSTKTLLVENV